MVSLTHHLAARTAAAAGEFRIQLVIEEATICDRDTSTHTHALTLNMVEKKLIKTYLNELTAN